MFCNFQKISTGFSWSSADQNQAGSNSEKDKIKKLDTDSKSKSSPTPANPDNFTLSPVSSTNLDTMPVGNPAQGQNPTQGQKCI